MKKRTRLTLYFLLGCLALYGSVRAYYSLTDGFSAADVTSEFAYREDLIFPEDSPEKIEKINAILNQKFSYLAKGIQAYALLSEDQRYILKIVKQKHARLNGLEKVLFQLPFTEDRKKTRVQRLSKRLRYFLSSSILCYKELPEESRLLYVHLLPTQNLHQKILIADKLGFTHEIDLDKTEFMLQDRAETIEATIRPLIEKGDYAAAKKTLQKVIDLLVSCSKKGIMDNDLAIHHNIGFINGQAMFMDVGQIVKNEAIRDENSASYQEYISSRTQSLNKWARAKFPQLDLE